jgi:glycosyltransferase involved in cell wall biosynthesis
MTGCELSVVIPCHNDGKYLSEAIGSVLSQEHRLRSVELVVVDDHSTDEETLEVLERWAREDRAIRVLRNPGASGPATARNIGVAAAASEWLAFLDADDVWLPGGLQARWDVVEAEPGAEWIGADHREWYENGSLEPTGHYHKDDFVGAILAPAYRSGRALRLERPVKQFLRSSLAWTGTVMVKRALVQRVGGFHPALRGPEDLHLWYRLALESDFFFAPHVVALYRQRAGSLISQARRAGLLRQEWDRLYRLLSRHPGFRPLRRQLRAKLSNVHAGYAWEYRQANRSWWATRAALGALSYTPTRVQSWKTLLGTLRAAAMGER